MQPADSGPIGLRPHAKLRLLAGGLVALVWLSAIVAGTVVLQRFESTPGVASQPPEAWPAGGVVTRRPGRATLVMLAHPKCSCTRASLGELAELMERVHDRVDAHVLFLHPDDVDAQWDQTELWRRASSIRGVQVHRDAGGGEAARFGAATSGDTVVYGRDGALVYRGGITAARGHAGDNPARQRVTSLLTAGTADRASSPVFGCPLQDPTGAVP